MIIQDSGEMIQNGGGQQFRQSNRKLPANGRNTRVPPICGEFSIALPELLSPTILNHFSRILNNHIIIYERLFGAGPPNNILIDKPAL